MLWVLFGLHIAGIAAAAILGQRRIRHGLAVAALPPAATTLWALTVLSGSDRASTTSLTWVEGLDIGLSFRVDSVALMMTLLVSGIGSLVFIYAIGYFGADAGSGGRFSASLLAFSASMLGLVLADSVWTLFIFWEFTSITSFLLVGHKHTDPSARTAARRALLITGAGGLSLLAGLLLLSNTMGTTSLTEIASSPVRGTAAAAVFIMIGAATKSAQFPFHVWLPGAMAAPTPVSAYLHSATMVKAGVLLVAVVGPAFADVTMWKNVGLAFGIASMLWGAIGALRQRDAKLILAWGTVSQLGLLITLLAVGTSKSVFAATSILFAHALFKAALFAVVGEIDIRTGTRDIAKLGNLWRTMPVATAVAVAAGLSMAGVPPLLGFTAKEAAIEAMLKLSGTEALIVGGAVILGSTLTVAYTARFLFTVFGPGPATEVKPRRLAMTIPSSILGAAGLIGFLFLEQVNDLVSPAAIELASGASDYSLHRWPGLTTGLAVSAAVVVIGAAIGIGVALRLNAPAPGPRGATLVDSAVDGGLALAPRFIARIQHGSLPVYLVTMSIVASAAAIPFIPELSTDHLIAWNQPLEGVLVFAIVGSAIAGAFVGSRLGAALTLGAVGFSVCGLLLIQSAPDLVLTQLLVETVIVVGFVLGLGHLRNRFPAVEDTWRAVRILVATASGLAVMVALAAASGSPEFPSKTEAFTEQAYEVGGGKNVVNVILTDLRGLDTLGEVVVLAVVAMGVLALARVTDNETDADREAA